MKDLQKKHRTSENGKQGTLQHAFGASESDFVNGKLMQLNGIFVIPCRFISLILNLQTGQHVWHIS